jgi:energy-coupling factor transporter ATP-binding protein EcfA2
VEIRRIQVKEGFLSGLDVEFSSGLNTIIGSRGVGKTALIELIRFCLAADSFTKANAGSADAVALSVLGSGEVTITLDNDGSEVIVQRSAGDTQPRTSEFLISPIVFSQTEIESVGLDPAGRLRMIDQFRTRSENEAKRDAISSEIRSLTSEIKSLKNNIVDLRESCLAIGNIESDLIAAREAQSQILNSLGDSGEKESQLGRLNEQLRDVTSRNSVFETTLSELSDFERRVESMVAYTPGTLTWPTELKKSSIGVKIDNLSKLVTTSTTSIREEIRARDLEIRDLLSKNNIERTTLESKARELREQVESVKKGSGLAARRVSELEEKAGSLNALKSAAQKYTEKIEMISERRSHLLTQLEKIYEKRFESRQKICSELNERLKPTIKVEIERSGSHASYVAEISSALRGSGLHYNQIAPLIASSVSPRELAEMVETIDWASFAANTGLSDARSQTICNEIYSAGVEDIISVETEDLVTMSLLDGSDYKPTDRLSVGQRCTVILSIILEFTEIPIIIDQPEDHLDNAFVAKTLIGAIQARKMSEQLIFSTHNANIPVLAEADTVLHLDSDGNRGFKREIGRIDDEAIVESVTRVMEGGREAFRQRADFYKKHPQSDS